MNDKKAVRIAWLAAALVFLVSAIAFILSYHALRDVASQNGITGWLAYLWPLLIDFSLVVFSLAILRANLYRESAKWPWLLVTLFTAATVTFNLIHAPDNPIAQSVAVVAPVALFLSFETLVQMLRSEIRRASVLASIAEIDNQAQAIRDELTGLRQQAKAAVSRRDNLQQESDRLTGEIQNLTLEIEQLKSDRLQEQEGQAVRANSTRQRIAEILTENDGLTSEAIAGQVGVSAGRVRQIRKELTVTNGNGKGPTSPLISP